MTLEFHNLSRSYDPALERIRFPGYDGVFEVPFFIETSALSAVKSPATAGEAEYLRAFDAAREAIQKVARRAYKRGRKPMYVLTSSDFG